MKKTLIILLGLIFLLVGCGEKSTLLKSSNIELGENIKGVTELHGSKDVVNKIVNIETQTELKKEDIDSLKNLFNSKLDTLKDIKSLKFTQEVKDDSVITKHELDVSTKEKIKELVDSQQLPTDFAKIEKLDLNKTVEIFNKYGFEFK